MDEAGSCGARAWHTELRAALTSLPCLCTGVCPAYHPLGQPCSPHCRGLPFCPTGAIAALKVGRGAYSPDNRMRPIISFRNKPLASSLPKGAKTSLATDVALETVSLGRKDFFFVKAYIFRQLFSARAHNLEILSNTFSFFSLACKQ